MSGDGKQNVDVFSEFRLMNFSLPAAFVQNYPLRCTLRREDKEERFASWFDSQMSNVRACQTPSANEAILRRTWPAGFDR